MNSIITNNLTKKFDKLTAVDRVTFKVKKGEIFGLLGPNGAGKTTIIKMLSTLSAPTEGNADVWGYSIIKDKNSVRHSIGMVFQDPAVDDRLTGRENLDFHARMYGMTAELRNKRIKEVLDLVELTDKSDIFLKNYSGGMKRRLEIARGLMHYPKVLFLDEPTLGLDPQTRFHIWEYIKRLNQKEGVSIILTTHYMEEADELCSRIGIIDYGRILVADTPEVLKNSMGNDIITVKTSESGKLSAVLGKEKWVKEINDHESGLLVSAEQGEEKIPLTVNLAQSAGIVVSAISIHKPTLEDVFLHYTGKTIREADDSKNNYSSGRLKFRKGGH